MNSFGGFLRNFFFTFTVFFFFFFILSGRDHRATVVTGNSYLDSMDERQEWSEGQTLRREYFTKASVSCRNFLCPVPLLVPVRLDKWHSSKMWIIVTSCVCISIYEEIFVWQHWFLLFISLSFWPLWCATGYCFNVMMNVCKQHLEIPPKKLQEMICFFLFPSPTSARNIGELWNHFNET